MSSGEDTKYEPLAGEEGLPSCSSDNCDRSSRQFSCAQKITTAILVCYALLTAANFWSLLWPKLHGSGRGVSPNSKRCHYIYANWKKFVDEHKSASLATIPFERPGGYWTPEYRSHDENQADAAWASINTGVGMVALEKDWAFVHGLPPSKEYPPDPAKSVFYVAAYHSLHCLPYLRRIIKSYATGVAVEDVERNHAFHCIGVLREELMCTASDAPLRVNFHQSMDKPVIGYNQIRRCTNWTSLRDWVIQNSACWIPPDEQMKNRSAPVWGHSCPTTDGIILPD